MSDLAGRLDDARARLQDASAPTPAGRVLSDADVVAIADELERRLRPRSTLTLLTAKQLAAELGLKVDYVYAHQEELGAMALGDGPKARLRFDLDRARQALEARGRRGPRPARR